MTFEEAIQESTQEAKLKALYESIDKIRRTEKWKKFDKKPTGGKTFKMYMLCVEVECTYDILKRIVNEAGIDMAEINYLPPNDSNDDEKAG